MPAAFRFRFAARIIQQSISKFDSIRLGASIKGGISKGIPRVALENRPTCCCGEEPGDDGVIGEVGETEQGVVRPEVKPEVRPEGGLRRPSPIFEVVGNGAGTSRAVAVAAATAAAAEAAEAVSSSGFSSRRKFPLDVLAVEHIPSPWSPESPRLRRLPARELFDVL